ncbi:hypothetical protein Tco_1486713 [Tanacetum coccineum]
MKDSSLAQDVDLDMWVILKEKFEKSLVISETCRHTVFRKRDHDDHSGAPPKGEKSAKKLKTSKGTKSAKEIDDDEVISEDASIEFLAELKNLGEKRAPIIDDTHRRRKLWMTLMTSNN